MAGSQFPYPALFMGAVLLGLAVPQVEGAYYEIREYAEVFSPKGPRQSELPSQQGQAFAYNNDVRIGDGSGATVGFMNGNCLVSAEISPGIEHTLYSCSETVVFTGGPYQGSSLTIVGFYDFFANNPLAIVGGTGLFRGATGELNYQYPPNPDFSYSLPNMVFVTPEFPPPTSPTEAPDVGSTPAPDPDLVPSATPSPTSSSPQAPSATPAPTPSSAPLTTCNPGSDKPNQCFNADGSSFVCCADACGPSGATATCT